MTAHRSSHSALTILAAVLAVLALAAAPAQAATYHHRDKTHDVNDTSHPPCPTCFPVSPAPTNRAEDIVDLDVDFRATSLRLGLRTRAVPEATPAPEVVFDVHTSTELAVTVIVDVGDNGKVHVRVAGGGVRCDSTRVGFDAQHRRWRAELSSACLRGATWVQVGAVTQGGTFGDDALVGGATCCATPKLSRHVGRG